MVTHRDGEKQTITERSREPHTSMRTTCTSVHVYLLTYIPERLAEIGYWLIL